jgi:hypothetical protein
MDDQSNLLSETAPIQTGAAESGQRLGSPRRPRKQPSATPILHFLSTQAFASPFDVNMAVDAGFKVVVPHTNAGLEHTTGLVQDAIFSRPVEYGCKTGLFIGGKDALLALDMLAAAPPRRRQFASGQFPKGGWIDRPYAYKVLQWAGTLTRRLSATSGCLSGSLAPTRRG